MATLLSKELVIFIYFESRVSAGVELLPDIAAIFAKLFNSAAKG